MAHDAIHGPARRVASCPSKPRTKLKLRRILTRRKELEKVYFDQVAGRFDRSYGPGRSWQAFGQLLLRILPPLVVADLGSGEGLLSELLARRAKQVIAVDNSEKMVAFGARNAKKIGLGNLEFPVGETSKLHLRGVHGGPGHPQQALHHAENPSRAIQSAHEILVPGGQTDDSRLLQHSFITGHELYGDRWLGFSDAELHGWLESAGFTQIEISVVAREEQPESPNNPRSRREAARSGRTALTAPEQERRTAI